ncbi:auxin-responsive protein SAUR50-like [Cornus florida]|uniref:auxin-responsive protein SAUR50-like n=1 Tax=Cornus florida TaxID=4283 RepID=UPI002896AFD6|nr:auxin-responsive protein SAUR50-like [Cornus florida]
MASPVDHSICDIRTIVKLKKMACTWRKLTRIGENKPPPDVPPGHLAVTVGEAGRRFIIKADYLKHPVFRQLLDQAYEEYGHRKDGPLVIPCDEFLFQDIIHFLRGGTRAHHFSCHVAEKKPDLNFLRDSRPLLHGFANRPAC